MNVKYLIAEMVSDCCPEDVNIGFIDKASTDRVKRMVFEKIRDDDKIRTFNIRKTVRIIALVAALVALLSATAFALGLFRLHRREVADGETVSGEWIYRDSDGRIKNVQKMTYNDAGLVFTFEGSESPHKIMFRPKWVPSEATEAIEVEDGWYSRYGDFGQDAFADIPYSIEIHYATPDYQMILLGECTIKHTGRNGDMVITEVTSDYYGVINYLVMFNDTEGYMIVIGGASSMDVLEHIAESIEIQSTDKVYQPDPYSNIGTMNIGRG